ncbi:MAG: hypothetical protein P4M05_05675 [Bradyrhizobium sp.]|nr:hypothetical protein [Bradyrhizobium sp.]
MFVTIASGIVFRQLDAGVEASGPHDFTVREISALVSSAARVHRIPPRVRDDRDTPHVGRDGGTYAGDLGRKGIRIFLQIGLDEGGKSVGFPAHEIGAIIRHLRPQRDVLEGKWHEHFGN